MLIERILVADSTAQKSIDVIGRWGAIRQVVFRMSDVYEQAMKRGVRIRFITDNPTITDAFVERLSKNRNRLFEFRYLKEPLPIRGAIYDGKCANMCARTIHDQHLTPSLWSTNPDFVRLLVNYFESLWAQAKKLDDQQSDL